MTKLIACLCAPVQTWPDFLKLVKSGSFEKIIVFADAVAQKAFKPPVNVRVVALDTSFGTMAMRDFMLSSLKDESFGMDVAVHLGSGSGTEHAAIMTAALRLGLGIRIVGWQDGVIEY